MSKAEDQDEKINNAIRDVLSDYKKLQNKPSIKIDTDTIYIIPVKLLGHNGDGLYFVHPSSEIHGKDQKSQKPQYSTAYVIPQDPTDPTDYTNINYIDVPIAYRGNRIASKLLEAVEQWCKEQKTFTLIRLENDTDINEHTGLPSTLYEKAGYHYLNKSVEFMFNGQKIMRSSGNEMEKVLIHGHHSEDCQFKNISTPETKSITKENEPKAEELVCNKSVKKKRDHWKHIEAKNMIGKIYTLDLRSGRTIDKRTAGPSGPALTRFSRRIKGKTSRGKTYRSRSKVNSKRYRSKVTYQSKVQAKRSRSKVKTNSKNKSKRIKV